MWDKKNLATGIMFAILSIICISFLFTEKVTSSLVVGAIVLAIVAIAFLKRARK